MHARDRLRVWLTRSKLTQREAARIFGIHYTFLNQILVGRRVPGRDTAVTIEAQTGIEVGAWMPPRVGTDAGTGTGDGRNRKSA
jgi:plasmid maintenance system antidote protein VapI